MEERDGGNEERRKKGRSKSNRKRAVIVPKQPRSRRRDFTDGFFSPRSVHARALLLIPSFVRLELRLLFLLLPAAAAAFTHRSSLSFWNSLFLTVLCPGPLLIFAVGFFYPVFLFSCKERGKQNESLRQEGTFFARSFIFFADCALGCDSVGTFISGSICGPLGPGRFGILPLFLLI